MRRLTAHQRVEITLDAQDTDLDGVGAIHCMLGSVKGSVATMAYRDKLAPHILGRLAEGSLGYLTFKHHGASIALRGAVGSYPNCAVLEFVVLDSVELPERRNNERVPMSISVRATPALPEGGPAEPILTTSADVSITGALIERRPGLEAASRLEIELVVPGSEEPIRCGADVARQTPDHIGVAFTGLQYGDHMRLSGILAVHRRIAGLAA
jgi:hypothetical protein